MKLKEKRKVYEEYKKLCILYKLEGLNGFLFMRKIMEDIQKIVGKDNIKETWKYIDLRNVQSEDSLYRKTGFSEWLD